MGVKERLIYGFYWLLCCVLFFMCGDLNVDGKKGVKYNYIIILYSHILVFNVV